MRIIAGSKRGMKLFSPKTDVSRPISDRVKESLFSVLCKYDLPMDKRVGDLFSGVGSLGLEALSRGAEFVSFVEKDPDVIAILRKNVEKLGFVKQSNVIRGDAFKVGAAGDFNEQKHGLVFVDPPYSATSDVSIDSPLSGLLALLRHQLETGGIVVVRTDKYTELLERYDRLKTIERRRWGNMAVTILQHRNNDK